MSTDTTGYDGDIENVLAIEPVNIIEEVEGSYIEEVPGITSLDMALDTQGGTGLSAAASASTWASDDSLVFVTDEDEDEDGEDDDDDGGSASIEDALFDFITDDADSDIQVEDDTQSESESEGESDAGDAIEIQMDYTLWVLDVTTDSLLDELL